MCCCDRTPAITNPKRWGKLSLTSLNTDKLKITLFNFEHTLGKGKKRFLPGNRQHLRNPAFIFYCSNYFTQNNIHYRSSVIISKYCWLIVLFFFRFAHNWLEETKQMHGYNFPDLAHCTSRVCIILRKHSLDNTFLTSPSIDIVFGRKHRPENRSFTQKLILKIPLIVKQPSSKLWFSCGNTTPYREWRHSRFNKTLCPKHYLSLTRLATKSFVIHVDFSEQQFWCLLDPGCGKK